MTSQHGPQTTVVLSVAEPVTTDLAQLYNNFGADDSNESNVETLRSLLLRMETKMDAKQSKIGAMIESKYDEIEARLRTLESKVDVAVDSINAVSAKVTR